MHSNLRHDDGANPSPSFPGPDRDDGVSFTDCGADMHAMNITADADQLEQSLRENSLNLKMGRRRGPETMDETDLKILRCLQEFPQSSVTDIAKLVGLSHTPCWRRIRQLEESGTIQSHAIILDPRVMGFDINVLALVNLETSDDKTCEAFETSASASPHVIECAAITGDTDYLLKIVMRSVTDYEHFLRKELMKFPGVKGVRSQFVLKQVKNSTKLPI